METNILGSVLIAFIICAILFFILREFFCWYYKINEIVGILKKIEAKLPSLPEQPLTSLESLELNEPDKESRLIKEYRDRFITYRTGKLIKMQSKGLSSYTEEALAVISEILKERKERGED